jgi:hypothetical protein
MDIIRGDRVRIVSEYVWCGQAVHGDVGVVMEVYPTPLPDGDLLAIRRVGGDGTGYGSLVPVWRSEVVAIPEDLN